MRISPVTYLTGVSTDGTRALGRPDLGLLATPASSVHLQRHHYAAAGWAADNGCFKERHPVDGRPFDQDAWLDWLDDCGPAGCRFVALPDVLDWHDIGGELVPIGDPVATWERSEPMLDVVHARGFPAAIVLQDGIEDHPSIVAEIMARADAVFVGGSDAFKLGPAAADLVDRARREGLWTHVGRVNTWGRMLHCARIGAHSADGTYLKYGRRDENLPNLVSWLNRLAHWADQLALFPQR